MCSAHVWKRIFENMHLEKMARVIFVWNQDLFYLRSPQVVKTKKTRSALVINFQVVSRRDGCSEVHSRRMWYSVFYGLWACYVLVGGGGGVGGRADLTQMC